MRKTYYHLSSIVGLVALCLPILFSQAICQESPPSCPEVSAEDLQERADSQLSNFSDQYLVLCKSIRDIDREFAALDHDSFDRNEYVQYFKFFIILSQQRTWCTSYSLMLQYQSLNTSPDCYCLGRRLLAINTNHYIRVCNANRVELSIVLNESSDLELNELHQMSQKMKTTVQEISDLLESIQAYISIQ